MTPLAHVLALPVRAYRLVLSPWVGHGCRYQPTCSAYALEALERHGGANLVPVVGSVEHQRCRYFMHYAEGSLMPPLLIKLISSKIRSAKVPFFAKPITAKVADNLNASLVTGALIKHTAFLESELAQRQWMCGDHMTIADVQMSYPLEALASRSDASTAMPQVLRVLNAMRARPAYQRAIERGGPIMID